MSTRDATPSPSDAPPAHPPGQVVPRPDLAAIAHLVEAARRLLFPGFFDPPSPSSSPSVPPPSPATLRAAIASILGAQLPAVIKYGISSGASDMADSAPGGGAAVTQAFLARLPSVHARLLLDVQACYDGDPAASHPDEVVLCYPGLDAVFAHRLAHELHTLGVPLIPRIIAEQAHSRTGIDIHPGARIGDSFFIDHGTGLVIGETTIIGDAVKVYQGVTLGAKSIRKDAHGRVVRGTQRHPTIGNRVTIYAGAVILGGDTVIGDDCVIAGGVFVTSSVPAGHVVMQGRSELTLRKKGEWGAEMFGEGI
ncbi:MAG: serine acetyltransferase [Phycisphaerales bacterium]|nr:serine acetyltransferase [Phycisphaerales bacterium]